MLAVIAGLVALATIAVAVFVATFDVERYKPDVIRWVKERTGRDLTIDGPLRLGLRPGIGLSTGGITLSERGGSETFASVKSVRLSLALWPLLRGSVTIDDMRLDGLKVGLLKRADGTTNFDDLLEAPPTGTGEPPQQPGESHGGAFSIALGSLELENAEVRWHDQRDGTKVRVTKLQGRLGRLAIGQSGEATLNGQIVGEQPQADLKFSTRAAYRLHSEGGAALTGLSARVQGDAGGMRGVDAALKGDVDIDPARSLFGARDVRLEARTQDGIEIEVRAPKLQVAADGAAGESANATFRLQAPDRNLEAKLALSPVRGGADRFNFENVGLEAKLKQGDASYAAELRGPLALDLQKSTGELPSIEGVLQLANPALGSQPISGSVQGSVRGSWSKPGTASAALTAKLEGSTLKASIDIADVARRAFRFAVDADRLDLDRYLPAGRPSPTTGHRAAAPPAGERKAAPLLDFDRLAGLDFSGTVQVRSLLARGVRLDRLNLGLRARDARLDVSPLAAALYGGTVTGSASLDARARRWHLAQQVAGVQAGPLLRAVARLDRLEGRANATLDLTTSGETTEAMTRALQGTARIGVTDGAIKGVNLPEMMRQASALLGSKTSLEREARGGDRTDFSDLSASFVVRDGVASTNDLSFRSDALRANGSGRFELVTGAVDYKLNTTLVGVSADIRNRVIARLGEVTIPVRVTGTVDAPKFNVDLGGLAAGALGSELSRQLQRGAEKGGDPVKDLLRGLFGK